jgi:hypothetical protein
MSRSLLLAGLASAVLYSAAAFAQTTVEVIDAGAQPRQPLRYQFQAGRNERAALDMNMRVDLDLQGQKITMGEVPNIRMVMQMRTIEVATDGSARIQFELQSAEADASHPQAAQINQALAGSKGLAGSYRIDALGNVSDSQVDSSRSPANAQAGAAVLEDLERSLQQLSSPFPQEAVGVGSRWRVRQNVSNADMRMSQTAEYTLRSRDGNRIVVDVKLVDASIDALDALPPGAKVDSVKVQGGGESSIPLDGLVPGATIEAAFILSLSMNAGGQNQSLGMNIQMNQAMAPAQ